MKPTAAQFRSLLERVYAASAVSDQRIEVTKPDGTTMQVSERQLLISCVVGAAECAEEAVAIAEHLDKQMLGVVLPALQQLLISKSGTPQAATPVAEETEEDLPTVHATTTSSGPATQPAPAQHVSRSTIPVGNGQGKTVTTSAPQPIPPRA